MMRSDIIESEEERTQREDRDKIREDRKRDRERDHRMEALGHKKSKLSRDSDRDISEKIALGEQPQTASSETMYDQRLFNQTEGLDSGYANDEAYNIYDKALFKGTSASILYRPKKNEETFGTEENLDKLLSTNRFKPDKPFSGVGNNKPNDSRSTPVEFEKDEKDEEDPFGLNEFLKEAKTSRKKNSLDKIGKTGTLHAGSAGGGPRR